MFWLIVSLLAAGAAWFYLNKRKQDASPAAGTVEKSAASTKPIWGRRFVPGVAGSVCDAARACAGKCYELNQTPKLPLPGCSFGIQCQCHFENLSERRSGKERRSGIERRPNLRFDPDKPPRRSGRDRREKNNTPFNDVVG